VNFIKKQVPIYKQLVIAAKLWRDQSNISDRTKLPKSYLLELVCLQVWLENQKEQPLFQLFRRFLEFMTRRPTHVIFYENYSKDQIPTKVARSNNVVLDVVHPGNNLSDGVDWLPMRTFALLSLAKLK